jgi:hypothetical protein
MPRWTAHELARELLEGPDVDVVIMPGPGICNHLNDIDNIVYGTYPQPSWAENAGEKNQVVVFQASEETLNEDEEFEQDDDDDDGEDEQEEEDE